MNPSTVHDQRRLVPRWRSYVVTLRAGELGTPRNERQPAPSHPELVDRLEVFGMAPTLVTAAEAVEAAIVSGREQDGVSAARRLVNIDKDAAPLIRQQAAALLHRTGHAADIPGDIVAKPNLDAGGTRRLIRINPHDPIAWVELALQQTIQKHGKAALKSMRVALNLAPHNRHVLRSASRLFLHLQDFERAHDVLARNTATRSDPWLMAAEIAVAGVAKRSIRNFKVGIATIEDGGLMPHQITELAGALGTEDLIGGNRRRSRKMFVRSMSDPTGNALAQGEWAALQLGSDIVPAARLDTVPEAFEAKAFHLYRDSRLTEVPGMCEEWAEVDPFFVRPFEFGAAIAGMIGDYATAERLAEKGLRLRKDAPKLLNSMIFTLASSGRPNDAAALLNRLPKVQDEINALVTSANKGLIAYRQGRNAEARQLYIEAIDGFRRLGDRRMGIQAFAYLARESILAKEPDAEALLLAVKKATKDYQGHQATELKIILDCIDESLGRKKTDTAQKTPGPDRIGHEDRGQIRWSTPGLPAHLSMNIPENAPSTKHDPKGTKK
jgi:tetratricopeptide (TPR) repeat protein